MKYSSKSHGKSVRFLFQKAVSFLCPFQSSFHRCQGPGERKKETVQVQFTTKASKRNTVFKIGLASLTFSKGKRSVSPFQTS